MQEKLENIYTWMKFAFKLEYVIHFMYLEMQIKMNLYQDDFSGLLRWIEQTKSLIARATFVYKIKD